MVDVRDWMYKPRRLPEFEAGVIEFLNASFSNAGGSSQMCCPCKKCMNRYWYRRDEGKYDVPDAARQWVLMTIGNAYKLHKCRFKKQHFYQYKDNKTRWKNKPKNIKDDDFSKLMTLWNNKNEAKRCLQAKEARMSQKNMHTAGPKSFARIREEMNRMKNYKPTDDVGDSLDPFTVVMNKERTGYRRIYGRGVSSKMIQNLDGCGHMESMNKDHLLEMQKTIEDDYEKKKAELKAIEEDQQKQKAEMEEVQRNVVKQQQILLQFFEQLPGAGQELQK